MDTHLQSLERELMGDQFGQFGQQQVNTLKQHNIEDLDREKEQILLAQVSEKSQDLNIDDDDVNSNTQDCYFLLKSNNHDNIAISISNCTWATLPHNQAKLNDAYYKYERVILVFSVNKSGSFQGYAIMRSPIQHKSRNQSWTGGALIGGDFDLEWQYVVDLPFNQTEQLRNPWNEGKPVKIGRDGQTIHPGVGRKLIVMIDELAQRMGVQKQVASKIFSHDKQRKPAQQYNQGYQNGAYRQGQQQFGNNQSMGYNSQYGNNYIYNSEGAQMYNPYINSTMNTYGQSNLQQQSKQQIQPSQVQNSSYNGQQYQNNLNDSNLQSNQQNISSLPQQINSQSINNNLLSTQQQQLMNNFLTQNPLQVQQLLNSVQVQNPLQLQQQLAYTLQLQQQQQQQQQQQIQSGLINNQVIQNSNKKSSESSVQNSRDRIIPNEQSVYDNGLTAKRDDQKLSQRSLSQHNVKSENKQSYSSDSDDASSVSSMFENGHRMSYVTYLESFTKLQSKTKFLNVQNTGQQYLQNILQVSQQQAQQQSLQTSKQQETFGGQNTEQYGYLGGANQSNQVGSKRTRENYSQVQAKDNQRQPAKRSNSQEKQKMYSEDEYVQLCKRMAQEQGKRFNEQQIRDYYRNELRKRKS